MKRILTALVVVALTAAAPTIAAARAHQTVCSGALGPGTFDGGIIVAPGASCFIHDATVNGGVTTSDPSFLEICGSTVNGRVEVTAGTCVIIGASPDELLHEGERIDCFGSTINGHISIENVDNETATPCPSIADVEIQNASINGGADINNNDTVEVEGNSIHGVLSCEGNAGSVTNDGFLNTVTGEEKGQCAGF